MKASGLLAICLLALGASGLAQAADTTTAPQAAPMGTLSFDPSVLATLDAVFGTHSSDDNSKSADHRANGAEPSSDPDCAPRAHAGTDTATHHGAVIERGHGGGSDVAPDALPRTPGLSWQSLLPGSIQ